MEPFHAKLIAAATGSTVTALTSKLRIFLYLLLTCPVTPFDVVKTRLQTQSPRRQPLFPNPPHQTCCQPSPAQCVRRMSSLARSLAHDELVCVWENGVFKAEPVNGFLDAIRHVWRAEGLRGLWKGAGTTVSVFFLSSICFTADATQSVIGVPSSTCYMLTYDHLLNVLLPPLLPSQSIVPLTAGILARSAISTIMSPLELIRTNLQSTPLSPSNPNTLRSVLTSIRTCVRVQGATYLWRGLGPTLWRDVPFSGLYWAGYEFLKHRISRRYSEGAWVSFVSGALSGTCAALVTSPSDVVKTRRQALVMTSPSRISSTSLLLQICQKEGFSALFAGAVPRMAKIAPACGIMIACFEVCLLFLLHA